MARQSGGSVPAGVPEAQGLRLVPAMPEHAGIWWQWRAEAVTRRFNPLRDLGIDELAARLAVSGPDLRDRSRLEYRWMAAHGEQLIGTVSLVNHSWTLGHGEITYMLGAAWQGRGLAVPMVGLLVDKVFAEAPLVRLIATIVAGHEASCRVVERLGFTREGRLRQHYVLNGRRVDQLVYGLLKAEWESRFVSATA